MPLVKSILSSGRTEIIDPESSRKEYWDRLKECRVTGLQSIAGTWEEMARYYLKSMVNLPNSERKEFVRGAQCLRYICISGCVPADWVLRFWREDIGIQLPVMYSASELAKGFTVLYPGEGIGLEICPSCRMMNLLLMMAIGRGAWVSSVVRMCLSSFQKVITASSLAREMTLFLGIFLSLGIFHITDTAGI